LLAEQDAAPIGFALCRAILDEAELLLIAVKPQTSRHGVGSRLLRAVIDSARVRGIAKLFLEVRANNPAIALYAAHGFTKVGQRRDYYRGSDGNVFDAYSYSLAL
jgi:[ribosomal protein S18]-alanine N-acetyltransferase